MIIVLMGVSGNGKSTIGKMLTQQLEQQVAEQHVAAQQVAVHRGAVQHEQLTSRWKFIEADDYHSAENIRKMANGEPLTDDDRWPWLDALAAELQQVLASRQYAVLACSALKKRYRQRLAANVTNIHFVHLQGDYSLILSRLQQRSGHFMPAALLRSQFDTLEACSQCTEISIDQTPVAITAQIIQQLALDKIYYTNVLADGLMFPEAPRWHNDALWFTDQHAQRVFSMNATGDLTEIIQTPDLPGGLGWLPDGTPLLVLMTQRRVCRIVNGKLENHADLSKLASFHCNDMLVNTQGCAWVGNFGYDLHAGEAIKSAEIVFISADGDSHISTQDVIFPNGMAISADGNTLIVAETFAARITAFDITADGSLINKRLWADLRTAKLHQSEHTQNTQNNSEETITDLDQLGANAAFPDGICLHPDGSLWVAAPNIGQVLQLREGGKILHRVFTYGRPYACMLGGKRNQQLYITSSETDDPAQAKIQRSGRIELLNLS